MNSVKRTQRALLVAMFVSSIPATLILPMLPSLGKAFDVGPTQLGLLVGVYPLMSMLASPFWGRLSDRYGRKPILLITLIGGASAFILFAFSASWVGLFIGRAMQGLAGTPRGIGFAVASDLSKQDNRAIKIGLVTAAMAVAFTVGPLIGGFFMGEDPDSWLGKFRIWVGLPGSGFNHVLPSLLGAAMNFLGALFILFGLSETNQRLTKHQKNKNEAEKREKISAPIFEFSLVLAIGIFLLSGFIQGSLQFSFTLWADISLGWTAQIIAFSGMAIGIGFALGSGILLKPMINHYGQEKTVLYGTITDGIGLLFFLYFLGSPLIALAGLLIAAMGNSLWATTILGLISKNINDKNQGLGLGVANGAALFGRVAGPAFAGYLAGNIGPNAPFAIILLCVSLAIARGIGLVRNAN
ncbi:MAG: MFS transporter [Pseudomonadota bacterium]|nr:MFS transporter [Pseudomonadota bacterium]